MKRKTNQNPTATPQPGQRQSVAKDKGKSTKPVPRETGDYPEVHPVRRAVPGSAVRTIVFLHGGNVGNWSWDPQVLAFGDFRLLTLHLPAFGARSGEAWAGLESAADDVAALIADEVSEGGVHLVGISLGGVIALHVAARHPELVESLLVTGTPVAGVPAAARALSRVQLKLLGSEWYWRFQAGAHGMVDDERELFASHGLQLDARNMRAIRDELDPGGLPANLTHFNAPVLVLAGEKEPKVVQRSFDPLTTLLPQAVIRLVPGMHHQWNIEDPVFFNAVVRRWVVDGVVHGRLIDPAQEKSKAKPSRAASAPQGSAGDSVSS
ncbi:alpha/beta hydrolase [Glutamicibacter sp. MNS18]|uniref:alpha/beta fold hydrolase n=1 Tax=Glutamicibacter sp. MNS18 TaxID=2989817 RepID=UPI0022357FEA|nr:alpha/beta hydrolase [Glutamicibacter sp. MNS18]MCW4466868.1 alpha/beta hydrolase [Glutamicibacter sp. MNS18]